MRMFLILLSLPIFSAGQLKIYNLNLIDTTKWQLYFNVENNLLVKSQPAADSIVLGLSNAIAYHANQFCLYPRTTGQDTLKLYRKGRLISKAIVQTELMPLGVARIGNFADTVMSVPHIVATPYLSVVFLNSNYRGRLYIRSFSLIIEYVNGDLTGTTQGYFNWLSAEQLGLIRRTKPGDQLHFIDIRGGDPDGRTTPMPPFTVIIK